MKLHHKIERAMSDEVTAEQILLDLEYLEIHLQTKAQSVTLDTAAMKRILQFIKEKVDIKPRDTQHELF